MGAMTNTEGAITPANPMPASSFWVDRAIAEIYATYGDRVSVAAKNKSLRKFGRTSNADSGTKTTVASFQDAVVNETFSTTNDIDGIVSTDDNDDQIMTVEGHYYDGSNNLVFSTQQVTLTGNTKATLGTSLCRANRVFPTKGTFASPASAPAGDVVVYSTSNLTSGKPDTDTAVKVMLLGATPNFKTQSEKCATSISGTDYWIITAVECAAQKGNSSTVTVDMDVEVREQGGVWRPSGLEMSLRTAGASYIHRPLAPHIIVPKNSDVRMVAVSNTNDVTVSGTMGGILALVV